MIEEGVAEDDLSMSVNGQQTRTIEHLVHLVASENIVDFKIELISYFIF